MARRLCLLVLIPTWLAANLAWAQWRFLPLGDLGGDRGLGKSSQALAVSGDGRYVVGESLATAGLGITTGAEALLWTKPNAPLTRLGTLDAKLDSTAKAVSREAIVVGHSDSALGMRAFRWSQNDGLVMLEVLPEHNESMAFGISDDGKVIVGKSSSFAEELAVQWRDGQLIALVDLPGGDRDSAAMAVSADGAVIVGHSSGERGTEACLWTKNTLKGLGTLGGERFASRALAVSADGKTVVGDSRSAHGAEAFRWTGPDGMQPLGDLPEGSFQSQALGVSANGQVIVGTANGANGSEAFLWTAQDKMQSLTRLVQAAGLARGWQLQEARGVSHDGRTIVGWGKKPTWRNGRLDPGPLELTPASSLPGLTWCSAQSCPDRSVHPLSRSP